MNDPTTLTDHLGLAVAAGVPAAELERAGFAIRNLRWWYGSEQHGTPASQWPHYTSQWHEERTLAFERVVIEWLGTLGIWVAPNRDKTYRICQDPEPRFGVSRIRVGPHCPTLSAALTAALRQIKENRQ